MQSGILQPMTEYIPSVALGIKTKMLLNFTGAEVGVTIQTLNDSRSGYEVIGNTNPYSTHPSIHEYYIMNDFHSNILRHDSSNSDYEIPTTCNGTSDSEACNFLPPSNHVPQTSNLNEIDRGETTTPSQLESPENTKPVFRKTPLPSRRLISNSRNSLTLLPYSKSNQETDTKLKIVSQISSLRLTTDIPLINKQPAETSDSYNNHIGEVERVRATDECPSSFHRYLSEPASVQETGKVVGDATDCSDFEEALSVYEVYTI